MPFLSTYLKNKKKKIQSKYHQVSKRVELKYELIHRKFTSRFHRQSTETEVIRSKISNLITQSTESIENKTRLRLFIPSISKTSTDVYIKLFPDIIDWYQGRFRGQTIRIVVRDGRIIEKVFLTPKGNKIIVNRTKLFLRLRSIPRIHIKLRLRSRFIDKIQFNIKSIPLISI